MVLTTSKVGPTPYYLPRVQHTLAHTRALFLSNGTAPSGHIPSSAEVTKAAAARFKVCIGSGAILSAEVMLHIMANAENEIDQKKLEEERRTTHRDSQHQTWLSLLNEAKERHLTDTQTTLNNRGLIPLSILKSLCKKLQLTSSEAQFELANKLLHHFGLAGELVRYNVEENEDLSD